MNNQQPSLPVTIMVIVSILVVFLIWAANLSAYLLQISAALIILYLIAKRSGFNPGTLDISLFITITLLLVSATGGFSSPFFFLIYFLLFGIALLAEPLVSLVLSLGLIGFFLATAFLLPLGQKNPAPTDFLQLFSLPLVTPLAYYFGREHRKLYQRKKKMASLENQVKKLTAHVRSEEEQTLLWLATTFSSHLSSIKDAVQNLDFSVKQKLNQPKDWQRLKHQVRRLETLAEKLKKYLEKNSYR